MATAVVRATHNGRTGTPVIAADWGARHAVVAARTMTLECQVRKPEERGAFDRTLGRTTTAEGELVYSGLCRLTRINRELRNLVAEQQVTFIDYLVTLPLDVTGAQPGDQVTFTADDPTIDPDLWPLTLTVAASVTGSHTFERDLFCTANISRRAA